MSLDFLDKQTGDQPKSPPSTANNDPIPLEPSQQEAEKPVGGSTPVALAESGGSGSTKGQSASGQTVVPKFVKAKRFVLKHSSQ